MRRFYLASDNLNRDRISISGEEARHIAVVLRLKPGDVISVFDGSGYEYQVSLYLLPAIWWLDGCFPRAECG